MSGTGTDSVSGDWTLHLRIDGVESAGKAHMVETVVEAVPGIRWARVDYALAHIDIRGRGPVDEDQLVAAVAGTGCTLSVMGDDEPTEQADHPPERDDDDDLPIIGSDDEDRSEPDTHDDEEPEAEPPPPPAPRPARDPEPEDEDDRPLADILGVRPGDGSDEEYIPPPSGGINVFGIFAHVTLWCLSVSLIWAAAYRFLPVPMTVPMFSDAVFDGGVSNQWVPLERISPNLIRAVIAAEDNEFCHHFGFDFQEINDAIREARRGGRQRGASTISQQTAKNAFLWTDHSWVRKGLEAYFTLVIEAMWPKRRIMEVYLNIAEWGPGIYGAEAASRHWFRKPASRLSPLEAARLAAILPSGGRWRASKAGPYVVGRAYTIQARANSVNLNGDDRCARP